ncbi:MAG TPA: hypothetical protein VGM50_13640 [Gemmatimonadaceae bacterium]
MLDKLIAKREAGGPTYQVVAMALRGDLVHPVAQARFAARALASFEEELARGRAELEQLPRIDSSDWGGAYDAVEGAVKLENLYSGSNSLLVSLTNPVMGMLRVCAKLVPADESRMTSAQLAALKQAVEDFEAAGEAIPAGDLVREYMRDLATRMSRALDEYEIIGSRALRLGVYELDGAIINQFGRDPSTTPTASEPVRRAYSLAKRLSSTVKEVLTWTALAGGALHAAQSMGHIAAQSVVWYNTGVFPDDSSGAPTAEHTQPTRE